MAGKDSVVSNGRLNQKELLALRLAIHDKIYQLSESHHPYDKKAIETYKKILTKFYQVKES